MAETTEPKRDEVYFEKKAAELAASFSYEDYKIVRSELFAHVRRPAVTIRYESITFNTACICGLEDAVYIQLLISQNQKRLAVRRCNENDKDAIRWCVEKMDKRKSRKITAAEFTRRIYEMMGWDAKCRYKLVAYKIPFDGQEIYVFELSEPEIFHERPKRTKEEEEELEKNMTPEEIETLKKKEAAESRKPFYPDDVENTFGVPVKEHQNQITFADLDSYHEVNRKSQTDETGDGYGTN